LVLPEEILRGHQDGAEALPIFAEPPSVDGVVWNYRRKTSGVNRTRRKRCRFFPGLPDVQQGCWDWRKTSGENRTGHKCCRFFFRPPGHPARPSGTTRSARRHCLVHRDEKRWRTEPVAHSVHPPAPTPPLTMRPTQRPTRKQPAKKLPRNRAKSGESSEWGCLSMNPAEVW